LDKDLLLTLAEQALYQDKTAIKTVLRQSKTIAIVGLSADATKDSYKVAVYLQASGYRVIPVNPRHSFILGERSYPDLYSIPEKVDIVDVFRPSNDCLSIVNATIACNVAVIWFQLGIVNREAINQAQLAGLTVIADLCIKIEAERYHIEPAK